MIDWEAAMRKGRLRSFCEEFDTEKKGKREKKQGKQEVEEA